jgi:hypothetical protein
MLLSDTHQNHKNTEGNSKNMEPSCAVNMRKKFRSLVELASVKTDLL